MVFGPYYFLMYCVLVNEFRILVSVGKLFALLSWSFIPLDGRMFNYFNYLSYCIIRENNFKPDGMLLKVKIFILYKVFIFKYYFITL